MVVGSNPANSIFFIGLKRAVGWIDGALAASHHRSLLGASFAAVFGLFWPIIPVLKAVPKPQNAASKKRRVRDGDWLRCWDVSFALGHGVHVVDIGVGVGDY